MNPQRSLPRRSEVQNALLLGLCMCLITLAGYGLVHFSNRPFSIDGVIQAFGDLPMLHLAWLLIVLPVVHVFLNRPPPATSLPAQKKHIALPRQRFNPHTHDALTRLPNALLLHDRLEVALAQAGSEQRPVALMLTGIDNLELIEQQHGTAASAQALKLLAQQFGGGLLQPGESVCQLEPNRFAIILLEEPDAAGARAVATHIRRRLRQPLQLAEGSSEMLGLSFGVACFPTHALSAPSLIARANRALEQSRTVRDDLLVYDPLLDEADSNATLAEALEHALSIDQLQLRYQPMLETHSREVLRLDVRMVWQHPSLGRQDHLALLKMAEEAEVSGILGEWLLRRAITQLSNWANDNHFAAAIGLRLPEALLLRAEFPELLTRWLEGHALQTSQLALDITGSLLAKPAGLLVVQQLRQLGIQMVLDEFGLAPMTLVKLRQLPIDEIKLSAEHMRHVSSDMAAEQLVHATAALARLYELPLTASGVDDVAHVSWMKADADGRPAKVPAVHVQGDAYAPAVPATQVLEEVARLQQRARQLTSGQATAAESPPLAATL